MKFKSIILAALASMAVFASCQESKEPAGTPTITVDPAELTFDQTVSSQAIALTATREWRVMDAPDWVTVTPNGGDASDKAQTVTIKVDANEGGNRNAAIKFTIGLMETSLKVFQAGPNGDKIDVTPIAEFIKNADTKKVCTLQGRVENTSNGDKFWGFDINDGTGVVTAAFPANWDEWKDKIQDGGTVVVEGPYEFYAKKGTHQVKSCTIISFEPGEGGEINPDAQEITIKEFLDKKDQNTEFIIKGTATRVKFQDTPGKGFGGFDIEDATGKMSCAFPTNLDDFKSTLKDGATVTVKGKYNEHNGAGQMYRGLIIKVEEGGSTPTPSPDPVVPGEIKKATVAEFLAAPVGEQFYELTGTISNITSTEYGNLYLKDDTGLVYIYGLTKTAVDKNDKSFASLGLKEGDILTLAAKRGEYNGNQQGVGAYYISHKVGEAKPEKPDGPATWAFTSSIAYDIVQDAYKEKASINGTADVPVLKLGKSKGFGKANLTIPEGTKKLGFYAVAWKGDLAKLKFGNGFELELERGNDGATSTAPYTITGISAKDYYEIDLKGNEGTLSVETVEPLGKRAIIFGINPVK